MTLIKEKKFCTYCGNTLIKKIPPGDHFERLVCTHCNNIHYQNPNMVVGTLPVWKEKILLCKRAIEPQLGFWTLPCGFLENNETVEEGALRETKEECDASVTLIKPFTLYSIPKVNQIYLVFLAKMTNDHFSTTIESSDVKLFSTNEIPWESIAFSSIKFTLKQYENNPDSELKVSHQNTDHY